jgi:uncharacterized protein (DUF885 family)
MYRTLPLLAVLALCCPTGLEAQERGRPPGRRSGPREVVVPDLAELAVAPRNEMALVARRYEADRGSLERRYTIRSSPTRQARMKRFHAGWLAALGKVDADKLSEEGRAELGRLKESAKKALEAIEVRDREQAEIAPLLPFAATIIDLEEARRRMEDVDARRAAGRLTALKARIEGVGKRIRAGEIPLTKAHAERAAQTTASLRRALKDWFGFYNGYDPVFTWWVAMPYREVDEVLGAHVSLLREKGAEVPEEPPTKRADAKPQAAKSAPGEDVPDLGELMAFPRSEMEEVIRRYQTDHRRVSRFGSLRFRVRRPRSPEQLARVQKFHADWLAALGKLDFDKLSHDGQIDYLLLRIQLEHDLARLELQARTAKGRARRLPFEQAVFELDPSPRRREKPAPGRTVDLLKKVAAQADEVREAVTAGKVAAKGLDAIGAARDVERLRRTLKGWFAAHAGDAEWAKEVEGSYKSADEALKKYADLLQGRGGKAGRPDGSGIEGRPIGREALMVELAGEMIPYTPEELMVIAEREFTWCEVEMKKASRQMGFGDDWRKALEKVKTMHVGPGRQPGVIRDLAREAIDYVNGHGLVTVPPLAVETWRMEMMSPERQMINPFFLGGEVIRVSFPTDTMPYGARLQSMRGNNIPFARATVHHELIPGHHLQGFMTARYRSYRRPFGTPFWTEGWALYWEMVLYDRSFPKTPEDRVGFLFWRSHRCARILFSLGYHLGRMSPQECIDLLVERVGHERDNATAEVRRSFAGGYSPLYQAAYMLGGLQIRGLRKELVDSGKMTERAFHDAILKENRIPIAMVRASLTGQKLTRDYRPDWKFYGEIADKAEAPAGR